MPPRRRPQKQESEEEDISIDPAPTSIDPYAVLSLSKEATQDEIKSAYRRAALKAHPDKALPSEKETANAKFQEIAFAYAILSDERRRKRYDTTGRTEESLDLDDEDFDWVSFYREQFKNVVTEEAIKKFEGEFKGSEEEREHVLRAYVDCEGNMEGIFQRVMLSDILEDEERFREIIDQAIKDGEVDGFKKYTEESEKSRKARYTRAKKRRDQEAKEAEEAEKALEEDGKGSKKAGKSNGGMDDLAALIQKRQQGRSEGFLDRLEEKYAPKSKKSSKRAMDEPPEEAFTKNRETGKAKKAKK